MPTKVTPVQPIRTTYVCDTCGTGESTYNGYYITTGYSSTYDHVCSSCGIVQSLNTIYPFIEYKEITE